MLERELDKDGRPTFKYKSTLRELSERLLSNTCLIFLGAGASIDSRTPDRDLPTGEELSRYLAEECKLEWHDYIPLSTIAFYFEFFFSRDRLDRILREKIGNPDIKPSPTVERLIDIIALLEESGRRSFVITTNYDQHFEHAYRKKLNREPGIIIYKGGWDPKDDKEELHTGIDQYGSKFWLPSESTKTYLYKMHGCITQPENHGLVITEEDYINFLTNTMSQNDQKKSLLTYALGQITLRTILFVGYSLADWNFRVIYKAAVESSGGKRNSSYAIQFRRKGTPEKPETALERTRWESLSSFWMRKNIEIINSDAALFMSDLLDTTRELMGNKTMTVGKG